MKCANCGSELKDGASFCIDCGTKVVLKKKFCMNCGASLVEGAKYCFECGEPVDATNSGNVDITEPGKVHMDAVNDKAADVKGDCLSKENEIVSKIDLYTKISGVGVAISILFLVIAISVGNGFGIFWSLLQMVCLVYGLLIHYKKINRFPSWTQYVAVAFTVLVVVLNISSFIPKDNQPAKTNETIKSETVENVRPKEGKLPISAEECVGQNYEEIGSKFKMMGFYNVSYNEIYDLNPNEADRFGEVDEVTVNGRTDYSLTTDYSFGASININYHVFKKCNINIAVEFPENWFFNKYDVALEMDGIEKETLAHGVGGEFSYEVEPGTYSFTFVSKESSDVVSDTITIDATGDYNIGVKICCYDDKISLEELYREDMGALGENQIMVKHNAKELKDKPYEDVQKTFEEYGFTNITFNPKYDCSSTDSKLGKVTAVAIDGNQEFKRGDIFDNDVRVTIAYHEDELNNPERTASEPLNNDNQSNNETSSDESASNNQQVYYSTNSRDTVDNGNSGKYAYKKHGKSYDQYYIIDFDRGYVYWFTEGNEDDTCDRIKIESGTLNDTLLFTYHYNGCNATYSACFEYKNNSNKLIVKGNDGFSASYSPTDITNALLKQSSKTICDY